MTLSSGKCRCFFLLIARSKSKSDESEDTRHNLQTGDTRMI